MSNVEYDSLGGSIGPYKFWMPPDLKTVSIGDLTIKSKEIPGIPESEIWVVSGWDHNGYPTEDPE